MFSRKVIADKKVCRLIFAATPHTTQLLSFTSFSLALHLSQQIYIWYYSVSITLLKITSPTCTLAHTIVLQATQTLPKQGENTIPVT